MNEFMIATESIALPMTLSAALRESAVEFLKQTVSHVAGVSSAVLDANRAQAFVNTTNS